MELSLPFVAEYDRTPDLAIAAINPLTGERFEFRAIVDTGADGTLLDSLIAEEIGIDLLRAPAALVGGVGGILPNARTGEVIIEVLGQPEFQARLQVSFASNVAMDIGNLLGLNFWVQFDVGLVHSSRTVAIARTTQS